MLEINNISKSFDGLIALNGVNMNLQKNKISMIIGPNGSGKTTLINIISGNYKADTGNILFNKKDITNLPPYEIYSIGIVRTFQIPLPFINLSVMENLLNACRENPGEHFFKAPINNLWEKKETEFIKHAFIVSKLVKLDHLLEEPTSNLSGEQMKLLEIGRSLMSGAKVIMLDEPIAGINPALAHDLFKKICELRDDLGITFILIEPRLKIALKYVDYVFVMHKGKILTEGKPKKVISDPKVIESLAYF